MQALKAQIAATTQLALAVGLLKPAFLASKSLRWPTPDCTLPLVPSVTALSFSQSSTHCRFGLGAEQAQKT